MINFTTIYHPDFLYNMRWTRILIVLLVLMFGLTQNAIAQQDVIPFSSEESDIRYNRIVDSKDSIVLTDEQFFENSAKVIFQVNKYGLRKNDKTLEELEKVVLPRINKDSLELVAIVIRGAASPEGPYSWNKVLSERRAKALTDFVTSRLTFNGLNDSTNVNRNLRQDCIVEDYRMLCVLMKKANDPNYGYVKSLCDKYLPTDNMEKLKAELMRARRGMLWKRLLTKYFPQLRAARIMLFFRKHQTEPELVVKAEPIIAAEPQPKTAAIAVRKPDPVVRDTIIRDTVVSEEHIPYDEILQRKKLLAVKTNLLFYGAYIPGYDRWAPIPNIALEYYPLKGHFTLGASFDMPWWQDDDAHKYFQFRNYQVEGRWYARGAKKANGTNEAHEYNKKAYTGFYLQGYAHLAVFGICFDENRGWVGEGAGAGLGLGYVLPLSREGHWRLELGLQAGFFRCKYDPYQFENPVNPAYRDGLYYYKWTQKPDLFKKRQYRWNWIGPTRVGITLCYDLLYRRIQKKGISFKSTETHKAYQVHKTYEVHETHKTYVPNEPNRPNVTHEPNGANKANETNNPQEERRAHE